MSRAMMGMERFLLDVYVVIFLTIIAPNTE